MKRFTLRVGTGWLGCLSLLSMAAAQQCPHPDFRVELIFQVPDIEHPSVVTCDDRGNLFVGEDPMDMRGPTTKEFDRIKFVEFNPDGSVRRATVFAEGLSAVFGMVWHEGALYVMHAPHYTMFKDTDGDGVADVRRDLADGFGPPAGVFGFNDHIVTGTRLGLDGYIYVSVGDKGIQKATGSDGSSITLEGGGVVRMKPNGTQLEIYSCGTRNHLDVAMDSRDNIFTYDNTDDGLGWWTRFTHHIPNGYYGYPYDYHPHADRHLPRISEHGGGSPVGAGCYRETVWPEKFRDAAFHCEWGKGKVQVFYPQPDGATFTAEMEDFLVGESGSEFRPQDLCFSPDGRHMYVADWNFGGWTQNKPAGRLYRVTYVGRSAEETVEVPRQRPATLAEYVEDLSHPSYHRRVSAQWALAGIGQAASEPLSLLVTDAEASADAKVHAIWSLAAMVETVPGYDPAHVLLAALQDDSADVRAQAARAIGTLYAATRWSVYSITEIERSVVADEGRLPPSHELVTALRERVSQDPDPSVRMQAAVALGRVGQTDAAETLLSGLTERDATTRFAMIQGLRTLDHWEPAVGAVRSSDPEIAGGAILAMTGVYNVAAVNALGLAMQEAPTTQLQAAAVQALSEVHRRGARYEKGWWGTQPARGKPARPKVNDWEGTERVLALLRQALGHPHAEVRLQAVRAQLSVDDAQALDRVRELAASEPDTAVRLEVFAVLAERRDEAAATILSDVARSSQQNAQVRSQALMALQQVGGETAQLTFVEISAQLDAPKVVLAQCLDGIAVLELKSARESVERLARHPAADLRAAAVTTLGRITPADQVGLLIETLKDSDLTVRASALRALGTLQSRAGVPAMIELVSNPELRGEAIIALASVKDRRALTAYLQGLVDRSPQVRDASLKAVSALRNEIGDDLLALHRGNELSPDIRRELGALFAIPQPIRSWQILGNWDKEHPLPELAMDQAPDLTQSITIGGRELQWRNVEVADADGKYEPNRFGAPTSNSWSLAYAAVESDHEVNVNWQLGSDDQAMLWINGQRLYEHEGDRGWSKDQGRGEARLREGTNHVWFLAGNSSGPWQFSLAIGGPDPQLAFLYNDVPPALDLASFRKAATDQQGNRQRGKELFFDAQGIGCAKCHSVGDEGDSKIGPNLLGVGVKYPREELIRSVLEPSNRIASGYEMTLLSTIEGETLQGIVKEDNTDEVVFATTQAETLRIPKDLIDQQEKSALSAMPNGLEKGMTLADFVDIIAYLQSIE